MSKELKYVASKECRAEAERAWDRGDGNLELAATNLRALNTRRSETKRPVKKAKPEFAFWCVL